MEAEAPKSVGLGRFARRFLRHKKRLALGFAAIPLAQLGDVGITLLIRDALNKIQAGEGDEHLKTTFGMVIGLAVFYGLFRFAQRWFIVSTSRFFERELKQDLFDRLSGLSFNFHDKSRSGDVVSRATSDVENLRMFLGPGMMYCGGAFVILPVTLTLLFSVHPQMAATILAPLILMGLTIRVTAPRLHKWSTAVQESLADISSRAQESFAGVRVVRGYAREEERSDRFAVDSASNRDNQIVLSRWRGFQSAIIHVANDLCFAVILILGGYGLLAGDFKEGDLFLFIDLVIKVFWPIIALGWMAGIYPRAVASAKRVSELLDAESEIKEPAEPVSLGELRGEIQLNGVCFQHEGAEIATLSSIDLNVPAGSTIGIVGPTGCGKTTLLGLIGRLHDTTAGEIKLDGIGVRDVKLEELRSALSYVPQDSFLFSDTYRNNLLFGADEPQSDEELLALVETACMTAEVAAFPNGLDEMIGERGVTLSGGQRQRTCIARALARDARILILDDCLSAVDTETEGELLSGLRDAGSERTVLVAAHRLSTVSHADQVLVLSKEGTICDRGTHTELTQRPGWYQETWKRQQAEEALGEL